AAEACTADRVLRRSGNVAPPTNSVWRKPGFCGRITVTETSQRQGSLQDVLMKKRNIIGGIAVGALAVGIWLGSLWKGFGWGGSGWGTGDGEQVSLNNVHVNGNTPAEPAPAGNSETPSLEGGPLDMMTIVISANSYRLIKDPTGPG